MKSKVAARRFGCVIVAVLLLALTACGRSGTQGTSTTAALQDEGETEGSAPSVSEADSLSFQAEAGEAQEDEDGNGTSGSGILIVYFAEAENSAVDAVASPSVTVENGETKGRMRALADMIQAETGGDLFSIQTSVDYPGDIGALIDYAAEEQDEDARPELTSHIENLDAYETIFVGYPNMEQGFEGVLCA